MAKRIMCIIISVLMIVSLLPTGAFAVENDSGETAPEVVLTSTADADSGGTDEDASSDSDGEEGTISLLASTSDGSTTQQDSSVASVKSSSGSPTYYDSIEAAIEAAGENRRTITLLKDVSTTSSWSIYEIKLDLAGHTLECGAITINADNGLSLTIQNNSENTGTIKCSSITLGYDCTFAFDESSVTGDVVVLYGSLTNEGGTFGPFTTGTFSTSVTCATGYTTQQVTLTDGTTAYQVVVDNKVAKIGETGYSSITDALNAASDGETVTVIKAVSDEAVSYSGSNPVTLDLNGYAVSLTSLTVSNGTLTITDSGSSSTASSLGTISATADNLKIIGGTYSSDPSAYVPSGYAASGDATNGYTVTRTQATLQFVVSNSEYATLGGIVVQYTRDGVTLTTEIGTSNTTHTISNLYVGDVINVTATATMTENEQYYTFTCWQLNGVAIQSQNTTTLNYTFTLTGGTTITAVVEMNSNLTTSCKAWLVDYDNISSYTISSVTDWYKFAYAVNVLGYDFDGKTVTLEADLDFSTASDFSYSIPAVGTANTNFKGTFDGNYKTISNITYDSTYTATYAGVFGVTSNATIKNLTVANSTFCAKDTTSTGYAGAIVANALAGTTIENCTSTNNKVEGWFAGGITGHTMSTTITGVTVSGVSLSSYTKSGCVIGYDGGDTTVTGATVTSDLTQTGGLPGAVIGQANGTSTLSNLTVNAEGLYVIGSMETNNSFTVTINEEDEGTTTVKAAAITGNLLANATLEITGGTYTVANIVSGEDDETTTVSGTVSISGGTYSVDVAEEYLADGKDSVANTDGTYTVTTGVAAIYGADGTCKAVYDTLAKAIEEAVSGDTVKLLSNVTLTETIKIYKSITLDLGDYTITGPTDPEGTTAIYTTQALTIKAVNGGITASGVAIMNQKGEGAGSLTIQGGTYTSSGANAIYNIKGTVTVESGTITSTASSKDGICSAENDTAEGYDQTNDSATVIVKGGTITGTRYGIYSTHDVQISGGSITGNTVGVYLEDGTATISGGAIKGYEGLKSGSKAVTITITGGTFEGVTHAVYALNDTVTVSGGTFTATGAKSDYAVALYSNGATITVTGGTFTGMYSTAWIKNGSEGKITVLDGYIVDTGELLTAGNSSDSAVTRTVLKAVAMVGSTYYATLQSAIDAASANAEVDLLTNVSEDIVIDSGKTITLDLNGYTLTNNSTHTIVNNGKLTITDSTASADSCGTVDNVTHACAAIYNEVGATCTILAGNFTRSMEASTSSSDNGSNSYYTILNHGTMNIGSSDGYNCISVSNTGSYSSMIENGWQSGAQNTTGVKSVMNIYGGTFTGGLYNVKNDDYGVLNIYNGTFSGKNNILSWNVLTISGGNFTSTNMGVYTGYGDDTMDKGTTTITGGTFNNSTGRILNAYNAGVTYSVSGGSFSQVVNAAYCADGYAPEKTANESGYYTVTEAVATGYKSDVYVAGYATLADALAATDIDTIQLIANATVSADASASTSVKIDLNGHTLTIGASTDSTKVVLTVPETYKVVISDSSTDATGVVANYGVISVNGTLDIRDLGYTDGTSGGGLLGQISGKITLGSSSTFIVPDVWNTIWGSIWEPTWNSAANIMSSVSTGARVISFGKVWECTNGFSNLSAYDSETTYWTPTGTYLVEYFKTSRGGSDISADKSDTWTYPTGDDNNMIFAGWYDSNGDVYEDTSGEATAKFVKLFYDNTSDTGDAAVINFIGGSLRKDSEETTSTSLRFGYEIIIPEDFDYVSWKWNWSSDDGSGTVSGLYYSSSATLSNEKIGSTAILTNLVLTGIPSTSYKTSISTTMIVTLVTGDGTTVTMEGSARSRSVYEVAYSIANDSSLAEDDSSKTYASSILSVCSDS